MKYLASFVLDVAACLATVIMFQLFSSLSAPAILVLGVWLFLADFLAIMNTCIVVSEFLHRKEERSGFVQNL